MATHLHTEIEKLRLWQSTDGNLDPYSAYGGWWSGIVPAAKQFIETSVFLNWSSTDVDDLLFAIARDSADHLVELVAQDSERLLTLSEHALVSGEPDARWPLAVVLGALRSRQAEAEALLVRFANDPEEYVSRRALLALAALKSSVVPTLAERAWKTGHEYQRIAALAALKEVGSDLLPRYLAEAHKDGRPYLVQNARRLETETQGAA